MNKEKETKHISFRFQPGDFEHGNHAVEKNEGGRKRRYLTGISSGIKKDLHGENMTELCIKSFHEQAETGDVLLYEGQHGVNFVDDIGKLTHSEITPSGDWFTEYRLYDEDDDMGAVTLEKADKLWKQVNGLPPYTKPKQKGFSIEGEIPDNGILTMDGTGKRVMNAVQLDGVVIVPRPAYKDSVASSVYKALGVIPPDVAEKAHKDLSQRLHDKLNQAEMSNSFYQKKYMIEDELDQAIHELVSMDRHGTSKEKLQILYQEYSDLMVNLILQNEGIFKNLNPSSDGDGEVYQDSNRLRTLLGLESMVEKFVKMRGGNDERS
jgi:hypothetical protein